MFLAELARGDVPQCRGRTAAGVFAEARRVPVDEHALQSFEVGAEEGLLPDSMGADRVEQRHRGLVEVEELDDAHAPAVAGDLPPERGPEVRCGLVVEIAVAVDAADHLAVLLDDDSHGHVARLDTEVLRQAAVAQATEVRQEHVGASRLVAVVEADTAGDGHVLDAHAPQIPADDVRRQRVGLPVEPGRFGVDHPVVRVVLGLDQPLAVGFSAAAGDPVRGHQLKILVQHGSSLFSTARRRVGMILATSLGNNQNYAHTIAFLSLVKKHLQFRDFTTAKAERNLPN